MCPAPASIERHLQKGHSVPSFQKLKTNLFNDLSFSEMKHYILFQTCPKNSHIEAEKNYKWYKDFIKTFIVK